MKITLLNGSPRNGNTSKALLCFKDSLDSRHSVVQYNLYENSIKACRNCNCCQKEENGCIHHDDSNKMLQTLIESDVIVFGTPVYYWGVSAQMKLLIDKFYSVNSRLTVKKKIIVIATGANALDNIQYDLIDKQFHAISDYLHWDMIKFIPVSAYEPDDITGQNDIISEIKETALSLK